MPRRPVIPAKIRKMSRAELERVTREIERAENLNFGGGDLSTYSPAALQTIVAEHRIPGFRQKEQQWLEAERTSPKTRAYWAEIASLERRFGEEIWDREQLARLRRRAARADRKTRARRSR